MNPTTFIVDKALEKKKMMMMMMNKKNTGMGYLWKKTIKNATVQKSTISPRKTKKECSMNQHDESDSSFIVPSLSLRDFFFYISTYIPVGCIRIRKRDFPLSDEDFSSCKIWHAFYLPSDIDHFHQSILYLPNTIQGKLLRFEPLKSYQGIHNAGWIRMEFKSKDQNSGQIRVYILPNVRRSGLARLTIQLYKSMESLLDNLDISHATWQGKWSDDTPFQHIDPSLDASKSSNTVSVFEILNSLPSPRPNPKVIHDEYIKEAMQSILKGDIPGIFSNTKMYPYQCRTAAMMLQREAQQTCLLDPRLLKLKDQAGNYFYLDRSVNVCFREPRLYESPRGGICAESMGLGKTLICLALILSTNHLSSQIPIEYSVSSIPVRSTTGSLLDMAASTVGRLGIPWESLLRVVESEQGTELNQVRQALNRGRGYYWYTPDQPQGETFKPANEPRKIWLTKATLVVTPPNLIPQWVLEIEKHTTGLKYLVMDDLVAPLPAVENLLTYDIIFFSKERFNRDSKLDHTPLKDIRFKRLITEEGHGFANSKSDSTDGMISIDFLHLDARWIVLGTPTQCLYSSDAGSSVNDSFPDLSLSPDTYTIQQKLFIEQELMDLEKLGNILGSYLNARPWADAKAQNDQASWKSLVIEPRYDPEIRGDTHLIKSTLKDIMIRHMTEDIDEELSLPPLHKKIVYLNGCFQDKLSLNLFSMMIVINAVTSGRKGMDYLFHPKSKAALQNLVSNLREASFTWSGFTATMIEDSLKTARKFLEKDNLDPRDKNLLEKAIQVGNLALSNSIFTAVSRTHEMAMYIRNYLHRNIRCAWALDWQDRDPTLMGASQLIYAKELFISRENNNKLWEYNFNNFKNVKKNETDQGDPSEPGEDQSTRPNTHDYIPGCVSGLSTQKMENKLWKKSIILSTGSSKLSYIMDQVLVHHNYEKIIIFYEAENIGHHIREALRCMDIRFLIHTKGDSASERSICVVKFNTLAAFRVMLMDVHQAAFCLDMIAASRIYFVNPVLSPQIEAQAIKRAHCTGQMRPVYVETLVLRGSIEEAILTRRGIMNDQKHMDLKDVLGDLKLCDWIQNMPFHRLPDENIPGPYQLSLLVNFHRPFTKININQDDIAFKLSKWQGKKSGRPGLPNNASQGVSSVTSARDNLDVSDLIRHLGREDQLRIFQYYRQELHKRKANEKLGKQGKVDNGMECCLIGHKVMHLRGNTSNSHDTVDAGLMASRKSTRGKRLGASIRIRPPFPARAVSDIMITSRPNQLQRASSLSLRSKDTQIERQPVTQRDIPTTAFGSEDEVAKSTEIVDGEFDQTVVVADEVAEVDQARQVAGGSEGTITMAELAAIHAEYDADPDHGNLYDE